MVDKSEKFNWLVRVGYFSRAILYSVLGIIALTSASKIAEGTNGIFRAIEDFPAGTAILWLMVVGLVAYALFRLCSPLFDIENNGNDGKGWAKRIGHAGSAVGHLALAYSAYKFASSDPGTTEGGSGGSGGGAQEAASGVLSADFGGTVLGILGLIFFVVAVFQAKKGITGDFMHRISPQAPDATRWLGAAGFLARGVVYAVIGWSLVKAGFMSAGAEQVKTLGDAVASLAGEGLIFTLTAIGLLLFGLFSLVLARYRIIPELDSSAGVPSFRA
ncbi:DUF1206 domain-containing protein [Alteriqipengyuania flavescens]|uniref:DUF1206 domain-containing protein n=1 Tax=Alteriqipengyuania flavescens TaxID=3053610 RepID=UPI0025B45988|nr:DUF1206 domain-containing protein [Alteriqipengyuania flavescens]WJY18307.1 DUF1206 domain-containing protein [Alteriqipengyuania flavescens]WJY24248.1 DUF1206 domain-containing protein [Alteriqipengyuania flavescens]